MYRGTMPMSEPMLQPHMTIALPMMSAPMVMPMFCVNAMKALAAGMSASSTVLGVNCHRMEGTGAADDAGEDGQRVVEHRVFELEDQGGVDDGDDQADEQHPAVVVPLLRNPAGDGWREGAHQAEQREDGVCQDERCVELRGEVLDDEAVDRHEGGLVEQEDEASAHSIGLLRARVMLAFLVPVGSSAFSTWSRSSGLR